MRRTKIHYAVTWLTLAQPMPFTLASCGQRLAVLTMSLTKVTCEKCRQSPRYRVDAALAAYPPMSATSR